VAGFKGVASALALCCASRFAALRTNPILLSKPEIIFRAGPLMPSDLFTSPSLRETVSYVTVSPVFGTCQSLPVPLGEEWLETMHVPPAISVEIEPQKVLIRLDMTRDILGIAMLLWERGDGLAVSARHVVQSGETPSSVVRSLAVQMPGAVCEEAAILVPDGRIKAVTGGYGRSSRLLMRQSAAFRISLWTTDWGLRAELGDLLTTQLLPVDWLDLADGRRAQILHEGEADQDAGQTQLLFRRDVSVKVIFDRYQSIWSPQMVTGGGWLALASSRHAFGVAPDEMTGEIPLAALEEIAATRDVPSSYRGWTLDCDGTVRALP